MVNGSPEQEEPIPPKPYVYEPEHALVAASVLDTAFSVITDSPGGWGQVQKVIDDRGDVDDLLARELAAIGGRSLSTGGIDKVDTEFVSHRIYPDPKSAGSDVVRLWREALDSVENPAAVARLEELLMVRREGNMVERARRAVANYLDAVAGDVDGLIATTYITRAWTISRRFRMADMEYRVLDVIESRIGQSGRQWTIGQIMPLLAIAASEATDADQQARLHAAAENVLAHIVSTEMMHHTIEQASKLRRKIISLGNGSDSRRAVTRADEMAAFRRIAQYASQPLVKQLHLETAARYATQHNLRDDLKQVQRELEVVSAGDLGLEKISSTVRIPSWMPEAEIHEFVRGHTWHLGLQRFIESPVPFGDIENVRADVRARPQSIRHLFPAVLLGADGLPRRTLSTAEEHFEHEVSQYVGISAQHIGIVYGAGLQRLAEKFGVPSENDVMALLLDVYGCDPHGARVLAKSFCRFWAGDYLESVYLAALTVEGAARRLLRELDEGAYQVQVGKNPGKYPALGTLLDELATICLDPSWHFFLDWLLLSADGANVRNNVAHGFIAESDEVTATLALRAAALLVTASGTVEGEQKSVVLACSVPIRGGLRGLWDRMLDIASGRLFRGHMFFERLRRKASISR